MMATKKPILPPALNPGDTIGIMAPSSRREKAEVTEFEAILTARGFNVYVHPQTLARHHQTAGTTAQRVDALHDLFRDKAINAIFTAGGGNRATTMLQHLDMDLIRKNPKILIGYSDVTSLLGAINKDTGLVTFHGPVASRLRRPMPKAQLDQCFNMLAGQSDPIPMNRAAVLKGGSVTGRLVGGNLSLMTCLLGTPWQPDFKGAILFLEDCYEETSRIDRMLVHLDNAGAFDDIAGLVMGKFSDLQDTGKTKFGYSLKEIITERLDGRKIPAIMNAPFGHAKDLYTIPFGASATLTAREGKSTLSFPAPVVK